MLGCERLASGGSGRGVSVVVCTIQGGMREEHTSEEQQWAGERSALSKGGRWNFAALWSSIWLRRRWIEDLMKPKYIYLVLRRLAKHDTVVYTDHLLLLSLIFELTSTFRQVTRRWRPTSALLSSQRVPRSSAEEVARWLGVVGMMRCCARTSMKSASRTVGCTGRRLCCGRC